MMAPPIDRRAMHCNEHAVRPRLHVYSSIPMLPPPNPWRMNEALVRWILSSVYHEPNGDCADYFLIPMFPKNIDSLQNMKALGDAGMARVFGYVRQQWPWWNQTVLAGQARHILLLPGDHGPGDTGFDRPIFPHKWSPHPNLKEQNRRNHVCAGTATKGCIHPDLADEIRSTWGAHWEQLNPASPSRVVIFLLYSGWADQLVHESGSCINCFVQGLDVRMPSPEVRPAGSIRHGMAWALPLRTLT